MRITVGGALLFLGTGAFVALGPLHLIGSSPIGNQTEEIQKLFVWAENFFKGSEGSATLSSAPAVPLKEPAAPMNVVDKPPSQEPPPVAQQQANLPEPVASDKKEESAAASAPLNTVVETAPAPTAVNKHRSRRRRLKKRGIVFSHAKAPAAAKEASESAVVEKSPSGGDDKLMGTYVALKLKTGREVKGVMRAKTATQYTLELPGMGPFQYPLSNVISVSPAE